MDAGRSSPLAQTAATVQRWLGEGRQVAVGRVVAISGFSTWPGDELVAVDGGGEVAGAVLGRLGNAQLVGAMAGLLIDGVVSTTVTVGIHGQAVAEAGLSCGGQADVLIQAAASLPAELWAAMAARRPVALATTPGGPGVVATSAAPAPGGPGGPAAAAALAGGHSAVTRLDDGTLVEAWVPAPRLVVVGDGDLLAAIEAQAGLLGWEARAVSRPGDLVDALAWAGGTAALVVLSHDPHLDVPPLRMALDWGAPYVGAMGGRKTQSRRMDRLVSAGVAPDLLQRIHRPIGLDLGGRSAAELALSVCAEILAVRTGRDGRSLRERAGPIHDRPRSD